jgi:hypothetical protein
VKQKKEKKITICFPVDGLLCEAWGKAMEAAGKNDVITGGPRCKLIVKAATALLILLSLPAFGQQAAPVVKDTAKVQPVQVDTTQRIRHPWPKWGAQPVAVMIPQKVYSVRQKKSIFAK